MIETFTREEFEAALPRHKETNEALWEYEGFIQGEHQYLLPVDDKVAVVIRSSIKSSGVSAAAGEDSIRAWLIKRKNKFPLGNKVTRWTTRQKGWQDRFKEVLRTLWRWRKEAGDGEDGEPRGIYITMSGKNKGKIFVKEGDKFIKWLE